MRRRRIVFIFLLAFLVPLFGGPAYRIGKLGKAPNFIALNPNGMLYATAYNSDEFLGVDLNRKVVTQRVAVGEHPMGFAIGDHGKTALIACRDAGTIEIVDLEQFRIVDEIKVGGLPNAVAISPLGYRAYVTNYGRSRDGQFHIIDIRERKVSATLKMGASPFGMAVSPVTELVYVIVGAENEIWVVDPDRQAVINKIPVGEAPDGIAITPDGKRVFVANSRTNDLSVIDTQLVKVLVTIPIGKAPFGVAVSPDGKRVFVVNSGARSVSIVPSDLSSLDFKTFEVEKGSTDVKVGKDNHTVYVVNELTNSVYVTYVP
jgi:YVTN family beta-propeller protein